MYSAGLQSSGARDEAIKLGANHGYRFEGDLVSLNAELAILDDEHSASRQWALQLWACETPYAGGSLRGIKVAEAPLHLPLPAWDLAPRLDAALPARLPVGPRDYSMVLVLASGDAGQFDQVHDFANYPARERFAVPHFDGTVGYRIEAQNVIVTVERVRNPRAEDNLTGSLVLELWALPQPYCGGAASGVRVAAHELPRIGGQEVLERAEYSMPFTQPPAGRYTLALMLREWTAVGYDTRDYCNFATQYEPAAQARVEQDAPLAGLDAEAVDAAAVPAEPSPAEPVEAPAELPVAEAPARDEAITSVGENAPDPSRLDARVSIQHASMEALLEVNGLNKKIVTEIIKARPFTSLEQLVRVRGIGQKRMVQLRRALKL